MKKKEIFVIFTIVVLLAAALAIYFVLREPADKKDKGAGTGAVVTQTVSDNASGSKAQTGDGAETAVPDKEAEQTGTDTGAEPAAEAEVQAPEAEAEPEFTVSTEETGAMVIMTMPAEDTAGSANISWYDTREEDELVYTVASDTSFEAAQTVKENGKITDIEKFYEFKKESAEEFPKYAGRTLYRFEITLEGLEPDTEYIYKVVSGEMESSVRSFKTAGNDGTFTFAWFADLHADPDEPDKLPLFDTLMRCVDAKAGGKADLVLFSGDLVKYGNLFSAWRQYDRTEAVKSHLFAPVPGNKEYYRLKDYAGGSKTKYYSGEWFKDVAAVPENGVEGIEGNYYFIYDNVMFVGLNSCQESNSKNKIPYDGEASLEAQKEWLKEITAKEAGNYDYIVAQEHYSFFYHDYDDDVDYACDWYDNWRETFDECRVDIALGADVHAYCRSKQLYQDAETADSDLGTVYLTYTELMDYRMDDTAKPGMDDRIAAYIRESINAGGLFEVTPECITFSLIDYEGNVADSMTVAKKNR